MICTLLQCISHKYILLGSNVSAYVGMVCDTLKNTIPKAIVHSQVREAKRSLLNHFYAQVGSREVILPAVILYGNVCLSCHMISCAEKLTHLASSHLVDFPKWLFNYFILTESTAVQNAFALSLSMLRLWLFCSTISFFYRKCFNSEIFSWTFCVLHIHRSISYFQ